ncbi:MAG: hypothetical protein NT003_03950 [Candidatus Magasanikbacteria bacterium]|nr:hypothetical protein [Candidatus Magasanikbacteria bacterium]
MAKKPPPVHPALEEFDVVLLKAEPDMPVPRAILVWNKYQYGRAAYSRWAIENRIYEIARDREAFDKPKYNELRSVVAAQSSVVNLPEDMTLNDWLVSGLWHNIKTKMFAGEWPKNGYRIELNALIDVNRYQLIPDMERAIIVFERKTLRSPLRVHMMKPVGLPWEPRLYYFRNIQSQRALRFLVSIGAMTDQSFDEFMVPLWLIIHIGNILKAFEGTPFALPYDMAVDKTRPAQSPVTPGNQFWMPGTPEGKGPGFPWFEFASYQPPLG